MRYQELIGTRHSALRDWMLLLRERGPMWDSCLMPAPCFIIFLVARILCKTIQPFSCRDLFLSALIMRKS